ncbi:monooxygenase [Mesorhizobium sp. L-8-10]|nr:monooxygenase [Mesorhizobium sp. L-8-10]
MVLSALLSPVGYDWHAWRLPGSRSEELATLAILADTAQKWERSKLDSIFLADIPGASFLLENDLSLGSPYEPVSALGALAASTSNIGLIGTISTTFSHPFTTARQLAGLDMLSGGRVGWNIVTSSYGAEAYGIELPVKADRYRRATEFVKVVRGLWSAWSDRAVINDRSMGVWVDPDLIKVREHDGEFFKLRGYVNIPRSPQGHPVLVQAGQSSEGLGLGAEVAEIIYTTQPLLDEAVRYYREQKARVQAAGRDPAHVKILPGIIPYVGRTEAEAKEMMESVVQFMNFSLLAERFERLYSVKLSDLDLGEAVPDERFDNWESHPSGPRIAAYKSYAAQPGRTVKDLLVVYSSAMGHHLVCGSATQVADTMIEWFESYACDGFSINTPTAPASIDALCKYLIPELQERGYARTEYAASTLRGNLQLPHPKAWDG